MIKLENKDIIIEINPFGAELYSIQTKDDNHEWLWQGDKRYFAQRSPILFPVVGLLKDGVYSYNGKTYEMPLHGFAAKKAFYVIKQEKDQVTFGLVDDIDTHKIYPFKFRLEVSYTISGSSVEVQYQVHNLSSKTMLFSIGAHPAFNVPFSSGEEYSDYYLEFTQKETLRRRLFENRLFTGERKTIVEDNTILPLNHDLFFVDKAVVLDDLKSETLWIRHKTNPHSIRFDFSGFPYMGLWSTPGEHAPFLCIEPWYGIGADKDDSMPLKDKEGIVELDEHSKFQSKYKISIESKDTN